MNDYIKLLENQNEQLLKKLEISETNNLFYQKKSKKNFIYTVEFYSPGKAMNIFYKEFYKKSDLMVFLKNVILTYIKHISSPALNIMKFSIKCEMQQELVSRWCVTKLCWTLQYNQDPNNLLKYTLGIVEFGSKDISDLELIKTLKLKFPLEFKEDNT